MRALYWPGVLGALLAVCGGCGKTAGGKPGAESVEEHPAPLARADLAPGFAQLQCTELADCCAQQSLTLDDASCETQVTGILQMIYAMYAKTTTYDSVAAAECLQAWPTVTSCGQRKPGVEPPEVCQRVFVGHAKPGGPCNVVDDCQKPAGGSVTCRFASMAEDEAPSGTCVVQQHAKLGEDCQTSCSGFGCAVDPEPTSPGYASGLCFQEDGLYCDGTHHCVSVVPTGAACTYSDVCAGGGYCADGQCHALLAEGEACRNNETCRTGACVDGVCGEPMPTPVECGG